MVHLARLVQRRHFQVGPGRQVTMVTYSRVLTVEGPHARATQPRSMSLDTEKLKCSWDEQFMAPKLLSDLHMRLSVSSILVLNFELHFGIPPWPIVPWIVWP